MENGAPTGPSLDRHLNFTERIEERHILASRRALANNKAGGAQMRPPRTPGCKHKLAGIGRLLVSCASQARMHTTHDPRHEKVADRRGSLGNSEAADPGPFCIVFMRLPVLGALRAFPARRTLFWTWGEHGQIVR